MTKRTRFIGGITREDVGSTYLFTRCRECETVRTCPLGIGKIQTSDIGKRVTAVRDDADSTWIVQVESDAQRDARMLAVREQASKYGIKQAARKN